MADTFTDTSRMLLLAMAFGQGAGTMLASSDALEVALSFFSAKVQRLTPAAWDDNALKIVEFTRAIGTLAAVSAAQNGRLAIAADDVQRATSAVDNRTFGVLGSCGC